MNPSDLRYARTHEWVHVNGDVATVGITDFAVHALTDVVHLEFPATGKAFKAGQTFGEIESVKAVSDLYAPVSGVILETNSALDNDLTALSDDPFGAGWIVKFKLSDSPDLSGLMDAAAYKAFCASEAH
jgi:glycine cleavage system H protein